MHGTLTVPEVTKITDNGVYLLLENSRIMEIGRDTCIPLKDTNKKKLAYWTKNIHLPC